MESGEIFLSEKDGITFIRVKGNASFVCAPPLAVLGNVVRVLTICLVAAYADSDFALGFYHDYSGYVVFIVAITAMVAVGELITRLFERRQGKPAAPPQEESQMALPSSSLE